MYDRERAKSSLGELLRGSSRVDVFRRQEDEVGDVVSRGSLSMRVGCSNDFVEGLLNLEFEVLVKVLDSSNGDAAGSRRW